MCMSDMNPSSLLQQKPVRLVKKQVLKQKWELPNTQESGRSRQSRSA